MKPESCASPSTTPAMREALLWLWPTSQRRWRGCRDGLDDPQPATLGALVRRGLAVKWGSAGWPIVYEMTDAGRVERAKLLEGSSVDS